MLRRGNCHTVTRRIHLCMSECKYSVINIMSIKTSQSYTDHQQNNTQRYSSWRQGIRNEQCDRETDATTTATL